MLGLLHNNNKIKSYFFIDISPHNNYCRRENNDLSRWTVVEMHLGITYFTVESINRLCRSDIISIIKRY